MIGILKNWNLKGFGFIEAQSKSGMGYTYERFFIHASRIRFSSFEKPTVGCIARFDVWDKPYRSKTQFPWAVNVELFGSIEEMRNYDLVTNPTLQVAPTVKALDVLAGGVK